ncbi:MAG: FAD-dependent oxidoreductase [Peptococcaceae bacterium]|jgi:NADPH-dependent 2,4-dienoyl-CoA reductase/sulfur reductase-like enzyme/rhodanese-related sulfurtransferase|nr:FAD-dependent oxidoreductase [Peptococcaceae bacterium]MBQ2021983.1 FAD-dependent oxidoreductase [Peptococcaceae bacterium]MBQ2431736.1 FAD-dependent oxidoreductase [Peptococcaceae bacterium]MBQ5369092.1 FAD-dependent oxidoreductase [Peptococcaceae bacterium]MBQ5658814.1 FAD-dependent oxidoreductase [Peptococcaceae bacterium]
MSELKIVVIGGVACGPKAAAKAKRCDPNAQVTLIEKGEWISYGGCGLPYYLGATVKDLNDLMTTSWEAVRTPEFMKDTKDIDTLLGWEATKINRAEKTVEVKEVKTGEIKVLPYDKLVIATGADNFKPPMEGINATGVFGMKTPKDAVDMQNYIKTEGVSDVVVIGAGLIGMECAEAFINWGLNTTVIEMQGSIFPQVLDAEMGAVFQNYLEGEDLNFMLNTAVEKILVDENDKVIGVQTNKGTVDAQMVLVAVGVRPCVQLAVDAGLEVDRGIVINSHCQTSDPDIYAGGDCVVTTNLVSGQRVYSPMGSTANRQGRVIGINVTGGDATHEGVLQTAVCKMFDWSLGACGLSERVAKQLGYDTVTAIVPGPDITHFMPGKKLIMTRLVADRATGKILGVQIVGPGKVDKRIDTMAAAMTFGVTAKQLANIDLSYAPPLSSAMENLTNAANVLQNTIDGKAQSMRFEEFESKLDSDDVVFVDLRTAHERSQKMIPAKNQLHIPIEELRARANEVPKDKEVVVFCILSTRGFEGQLILNQAGYDNVKFVQGGIQFWPFKK